MQAESSRDHAASRPFGFSERPAGFVQELLANGDLFGAGMPNGQARSGALLRHHVAHEGGMNIWDLSDAQSRALAMLFLSRSYAVLVTLGLCAIRDLMLCSESLPMVIPALLTHWKLTCSAKSYSDDSCSDDSLIC